VDVVEHDGERAAAPVVGDDVRGHDRAAGRGPRARRLGHHDRLEAGERLGHAVLGDGEVVPGEAADGLPLPVHHRDVDGDELHPGLEGGLAGRRRGRLGSLGGGAEKKQAEEGGK